MGAAAPLTESDPTARLGFGDFEFDPRTGELWRGAEKLHLRPQAQQLLTLLLRFSGTLVTRDDLRGAISGGAAFGAFDQGVNDAIREVRATLCDPAGSPRYIETLPRRGYRFVAPVRLVETLALRSAPALPIRPRSFEPTPRRRRPPWILALLAVAVAVGWLGLRATPRRVRLLVLPIVSLGSDEDKQLAAGLTEELISQFGSLAPDSLGAIARTTAFRYQGVERPVAEIRREVQVDYLVEGALRREGTRVRVDVRLVEARSEATLWSQTLERSLGEVLALPADIAFAVSRRVGVVIGPNVRRPPPGITPAAAAQLLRARSLWATREPGRLRQGVAGIEDVLRDWPEHAPALALLSQVLLTQADLGEPERSVLRARALRLAERALVLDDGLAEAHAARGLAAMLGADGWRFAEAERSLLRALALNPSDASARQWYSSLLRFRGRHAEALREARRALEHDPFSASVSHNLANALLSAGDPAAAVAQYQQVLELAPSFAPALRGIARARQVEGRLAEALVVARRARELAPEQPEPEYVADVVHCLARLGRLEEARREARALEAVSAHWPYSLAVATLALGDRAGALELLERAYAERDPQFRLAAIDPRLRALRGDRRFAAILRRAALE